VRTGPTAIVNAALSVAARDGITQLSMRSVAAEVGVTVMALYRHYPSKEALLDAMVGRMLSEVSLPASDQPWPDQIRDVAHQLLAVARRYPTVLPLLLTRTYVAPEAVRLVRFLYAALNAAGLSQPQAFRLERLFSTFVLGYVISVANEAFWAAEPSSLHIDGPPPPGTSPATSTRWDAELDSDLDDLISIIRQTASVNKNPPPRPATPRPMSPR
jgi:AcrR family transcriptional regulator